MSEEKRSGENVANCRLGQLSSCAGSFYAPGRDHKPSALHGNLSWGSIESAPVQRSEDCRLTISRDLWTTAVGAPHGQGTDDKGQKRTAFPSRCYSQAAK